MDQPAAIKATYCNFKNIQGRKQIQLIFEIPSEQADEAFAALGWPNGAEPTWVAIAKLNGKD